MKKFLTYFFAFFLIVMIVTPSMYVLIEKGYDIEQCEKHEEEKQENKVIEDFEKLKIYQPSNVTSLYRFLATKKRYVFKAKIDTSVYKKLETPPPELVA